MITFEIYNDDLVTFLTDSEVYMLKKDSLVIGYGKINKDINNKLEIYVLPKFRGNTYGKLLFEKLLKKIENEDVIRLTFNNDNLKFKKIVEDYGGKQESIIDGIVRYIVPTKVV